MCDKCNQTKAFIGEPSNTSSSGALSRVSLNAEDVGELRSRLTALEKEISILSDIPGRLANKLTPILPPSKGVGVEAVPTAPSLTEVGSRLQQLIDRVREIQGYFHNIINSVEL